MSAEPPPLTPEQEATMHENRSVEVIVPCAVLIGLCTVVVALRFAARLFHRARLGADDWFALAALFAVIGFNACVIISVHRGMGRHVWAVDPSSAWRTVQMGYVIAVLNPVPRGLDKMALLFLYRRVFTLNIKWFKYTWYVLVFYVVCHSTAGLLGGAFQCTPPSYFWERINPNLAPPAKGFCGINTVALLKASAALTIAVEVALFVLPIIMLSRLQMKLPQKIGFILVFGTGAFAIAAECTRLRFAMTANQLDADTTWISADIFLWAAIENSVGLICACLPTLVPILISTKKFLSSLGSEISVLRGSRSTQQVSTGHSTSRWNPLSGADMDKRDIRPSTSTTNLDPYTSTDQSGILRTDEYHLDAYPRTDDVSLHDYHDPTKSKF